MLLYVLKTAESVFMLEKKSRYPNRGAEPPERTLKELAKYLNLLPPFIPDQGQGDFHFQFE